MRILSACCIYFNPRSPWGERPIFLPNLIRYGQFQSTLPVGGATVWVFQSRQKVMISIHAPRGGSDRLPSYRIATTTNFNPRSPWGERRGKSYHDIIAGLFQSTLPVGGATDTAQNGRLANLISIHAPRGGSDPVHRPPNNKNFDISIHAPRGGSDE